MKKILKQLFNLWANHVKHIEFLTLFAFYQTIKTGKYQKEIELIRSHIQQGNFTLADTLKKKLHGITFSAIFQSDKKRKKDFLIEYIGVMVLDIDNLSLEEINRLLPIIRAIPYTLLCFISPSGLGIKIIVATNNRDADKHKTCYLQVINYYKKHLNVEFDEQTNDITRLCYVSHDPDAHFNVNAEIFNCEEICETSQEKQNNAHEKNNTNTYQQFLHRIKYIISYTNNRILFERGSRNSYIFLLSSNCNRNGINKIQLIEYCLQNYVQEDFTEEEIISTINSAYERSKEFGIGTKRRNLLNKPLIR